MSMTEITNEQFRALFPEHDSRYIGQTWKDHTTPGYAANRPKQPVVRVSWDEANAFCQKISEISGNTVSLPTETQWEWAARSGSADDFWFGSTESDFGAFENLADSTTVDLAVTDAGKRSHAQVLGFPTENPERKRPPTDQLPCCLLPAQSLGIVRHERECGGMDSLRLHSLSFKRKGKQKDC